MAVIELPALRSDDPLGFLASLGLVEVCTTCLGIDARLGWDGVGGPARFESDLESVRELASAVSRLVDDWARAERVVPPPDPGFIRRRLSEEERRASVTMLGTKPPNDPMRMSRLEAIGRFADQRERELEGDTIGARWFVAMVAQLGVVEKGTAEPFCDLTPLYAPAGQQTLFQLYEKYHRQVRASPRLLEEALEGWRRVSSDSGANLDYRDTRDAAASPIGTPEGAGVPGATWFALQSVPFFRLVGEGRNGMAVGWTGRPGRRPRELCWPVWRPLLNRPAIEVLLAHPVVRPRNEKPDAPALSALGVTALLRSRRRSSGNSDGPLQVATVVWP
jgi:hypothetical protein